MSDGEGIFKAYVQYQIHGEGDFDNPWFPPSFHLLRFYWSFSANTADCRGARAVKGENGRVRRSTATALYE